MIITITAFLATLAISGLIPAVSADTIKQTMEGGVDIEISYPSSVVVGRDFSISFLIQNNGWEDKKDVNFHFELDDSIIPSKGQEFTGFHIPKISVSGSHGETVDFKILPDASVGQHFLNVDYSQVFLENNETPREPVHVNIAIPINIKDEAKIVIHTITPESIFAQAEFPFTVEILSEDIDLKDVKIQLTPPKDIEFRGETLHTFSSIQKNEPLSITSRVITPSEEILTEYKVPFQILVSYTNDVGEQKEDSKSVSLVLRPRTFMELTTDGGIWIGDFFIAPYVSIGTIIGIPVGTLLSLIVRRKTQRPKKRKTKPKKV